MTESDSERVLAIYQQGMNDGQATFESSAPSWQEWDESHLRGCRIVAETEGVVVGWGALSPVSDRCVYGGVAEVSVYVDKGARGMGIGRHILSQLVECSESQGIWTLTAGLFQENTAGLKLHLNVGFRVVGRREKVGQHHGVWRDTLLLERRSSVVGVDSV